MNSETYPAARGCASSVESGRRVAGRTAFKLACLPFVVLLLPLAVLGAERPLKIDRARSFIEVDVKSTLKNFTAHLDAYDLTMNVDETGKIKNAVLQFKFSDLRTGDDKRNADMITWLGGGEPIGKFELGILALAPDGQGQVTGKLTFHNNTSLIEFSVNVIRAGSDYTVTGDTTIDYRNWNLKIIKMDLMLKVHPEVKIRFKLVGTLPETPPAHD
jgi:polyisoprenoid-binding protein YceI